MSWKNRSHLMLAALTVSAWVYLVQPSQALEPRTRTRVAQNDSRPGKVSTKVKKVENTPHPFMGVSSCSAGSCHGGQAPSSGAFEPFSEFSTWVQKDPHAGAYDILLDKQSVKMARLLKLEKPAHESPVCLNCHGPQHDESINNPALLRAGVNEGVGCEACHGNAEKWIIAHRRGAEWRALSPKEKWDQFGFRATKDLWTRAKTCAQCHVGAPGKDANHDLYAAGHPRLFFEMSAFNANLPAHWDRDKDRSQASDDGGKTSTFEAKLWAVGQVATVHSAIELALDRAKRATKPFNWEKYSVGETYPAGETVPAWPEFSETGCFACHHNLKAPSWRQARGYGNRQPGSLPWQGWLMALSNDAKAIAPDAPDYQQPLEKFSLLISKPWSKYKGEDGIESSGHAALVALESFGTTLSDRKTKVSAAQVEQLVKKWLESKNRTQITSESWDSTTQLYLGILALNEAMRDSANLRNQPVSADLAKSLKIIREQLELNPACDSPKEFSSLKSNEAYNTILSEFGNIANQFGK